MKYLLFSVSIALQAVVLYFAVIGVACMFFIVPQAYDTDKCQVMYGEVQR